MKEDIGWVYEGQKVIQKDIMSKVKGRENFV